MNLELHKIAIRKLEWGPRTGARDHVLTVNKEELVALLLEDPALKKVEAELVHPGDSVRILPCKDAVEPRCKLEGSGEVFPGWIGDVETVGQGKTLVLEGAAVLTTGRLVSPQEGIVDMSGPGAEYTPFSKTCNVVLVFEPVEGVELHELEAVYRRAGFKAAHYLASCCKTDKADTVESYAFPPKP